MVAKGFVEPSMGNFLSLLANLSDNPVIVYKDTINAMLGPVDIVQTSSVSNMAMKPFQYFN